MSAENPEIAEIASIELDSGSLRSSLRKRVDDLRPHHHLICVVENPANVGNLAAVIRCCNNLGISKVYVVDKNSLLPPLPDSIKTVEDEIKMTTAEKHQYWETKIRKNETLKNSSATGNKWTFLRKFKTTEACIKYLAIKKFESVVTSPHQKDRENISLPDFKLTKQRHRFAIWFGNESRGITEEAVQGASVCLQIPMNGIVESFNLSVAAGIVLYQIASLEIN